MHRFAIEDELDELEAQLTANPDDHRRIRHHLDSLGARFGFSLTASGPGISFQPRERQLPTHDAGQAVASELLDLPLRLHKRDDRPTLVVFDEFQDLLSAGPSLDGLLRSHVQYHGEAAVYVYAGSHLGPSFS